MRKITTGKPSFTKIPEKYNLEFWLGFSQLIYEAKYCFLLLGKLVQYHVGTYACIFYFKPKWIIAQPTQNALVLMFKIRFNFSALWTNLAVTASGNKIKCNNIVGGPKHCQHSFCTSFLLFSMDSCCFNRCCLLANYDQAGNYCHLGTNKYCWKRFGIQNSQFLFSILFSFL